MNFLKEGNLIYRNGQENAQAINLGHPKLAKLEEVVLDHFKSVEG